ncbi:MAG: hypothetical protein ACHQQR_01915 [Gemmatimonadales bacterium]
MMRGRTHPGRRLIAVALDALAALLLGVLLSNTPVGDFFARRAVVMLRIGAPGTIWKGPIPMLMGIAGRFVYVLPVALLAVALCEPVFGNSPGRAMLGLVPGTVDGESRSRLQRYGRALVTAAPWWGLTAALLAGSWVLALVFVLAALALLVNAAISRFTSGSSPT